MTNWKKCIGKRVLVTKCFGNDLKELRVLEVSPRGNVKFRFSTGTEAWESQNEYRLMEILEK